MYILLFAVLGERASEYDQWYYANYWQNVHHCRGSGEDSRDKLHTHQELTARINHDVNNFQCQRCRSSPSFQRGHTVSLAYKPYDQSHPHIEYHHYGYKNI